ncbi:MAG: DUF4738 domain-containing protein [Bacteroidaceae bacterium]|nr:DUF4738 domain-containing protein [Bacteroidaceae bacterium]
MKKIVVSMCALSCLLSWGSCGHKAEKRTVDEDSSVVMVGDKSDGVIQMGRVELADTVAWRGHRYAYRIVREPATDLPHVVDEETQSAYMDNRIGLTVMCDGAEIFSQTFSKADFSSHLDANMKQNGILDGMAFAGTSPEGLRFGTGVSYPQSDSSVPLLVVVAANGGLSIQKGDVLEDNMTP